MKTSYRGYEITVERALTLAGWPSISYYSVRASDGWIFQDDFHGGEYGSVRQVMAECKADVDRLLDHPEEFDDDEVPPEVRADREKAIIEEEAEDD